MGVALSGKLGNRFNVADWRVDARALEITNDAGTKKLENKVMGLLICLASQPNEVLTREELARVGERVRGMDDRGELKDFVADHDAERVHVGQTTFLYATRR